MLKIELNCLEVVGLRSKGGLVKIHMENIIPRYQSFLYIYYLTNRRNKPNDIVISKLDGVGPVDNRPSTNKLHQIVQKKKKKKNVTCDT